MLNSDSDSYTPLIKLVKISDLVFRYENLVYDLSLQEYQSLRVSIQENGIKIPIEINDKNEVLDGHHRARIANEIGSKHIQARVHTFENEFEEKKFAIEMNLKRRHLTDFQKAELFFELDNIETGIAKLRSQSNLKVCDKLQTVSNDTTGETGRTRDKIARISGLSPATYSRAKKIMEVAGEDTKESLRVGKTKIAREYSRIIKDQKRKELIAESYHYHYPDNIEGGLQLIQGDCREKTKDIKDNFIDMIFTDPPYELKDLPLYKDLGYFAMRILKPGGSLVCYVGGYALPQIIDFLRESGLKYNWYFYLRHTGQTKKMDSNRVIVCGKILLWFYKGDRLVDTGKYATDFIESRPPDKDLHDMAQSLVDPEHVICSLTVENQIILDPFMGSGTTGIAALRQKKKIHRYRDKRRQI